MNLVSMWTRSCKKILVMILNLFTWIQIVLYTSFVGPTWINFCKIISKGINITDDKSNDRYIILSIRSEFPWYKLSKLRSYLFQLFNEPFGGCFCTFIYLAIKFILKQLSLIIKIIFDVITLELCDCLSH